MRPHDETAGIPATRPAVITAASRYRRHSYGDNHPLGIPRVSLTLDLIEAYGAITSDEYLPSRRALLSELEWFHTRDYVSAIQRCDAVGRVSDRDRKRHNIGNLENPYFPGFFATPATATGGSIQAAEEVLNGRVAFSPAGGMHHAMPDQARGFCFFNDPVLAIKRLRHEGCRVMYVDIDAHHGDGVEFAFASDPEVLTLSLHMDTAYAYPFEGGTAGDTGALGNALNVALPQGTNDSEYRFAFQGVWAPALDHFAPDVVVLQAGTDMLFPDPLGKFAISTQLLLEVVETVLQDSPRHADGTPRLLVLGGGGYHPLIVARCWAGVWALLSGRELPDRIPSRGETILRSVEWDLDEDEDYFDQLFVQRLDPSREGQIRGELRDLLASLTHTHPVLRERRPRACR